MAFKVGDHVCKPGNGSETRGTVVDAMDISEPTLYLVEYNGTGKRLWELGSELRPNRNAHTPHATLALSGWTLVHDGPYRYVYTRDDEVIEFEKDSDLAFYGVGDRRITNGRQWGIVERFAAPRVIVDTRSEVESVIERLNNGDDEGASYDAIDMLRRYAEGLEG